MRLFSQREGIKPVKSVIQTDSMDEDLRNGLWNALSFFYWKRIKPHPLGYSLSNYKDMNLLFYSLWHNYFKRLIDSLNDYWPNTHQEIKDYFFDCKWDEVFDFIEFVANNYQDNSLNNNFMNFCNTILEREVSAYRFVGGKITLITSEEEISAIEEALKIQESSKPVVIHLKRALDLLSDRKSPDYRNSIKESISAVESICKLITDDSKATLGQALKKIEDKVEIHSALKSAFSSLYGYTSDAEGIRHSLLDEPNLYFEDAKFMLVSCSTFINYLVSKSSKAGIRL